MQAFTDWLNTHWESIIRFFSVFIAGYLIIKITLTVVKRGLKKSKVDHAVFGFITQLINIVLYVIYVIILCSILGIPTTSLVALLSAAALAISLALQNSLTNLASGFLLIYNRPFRSGDFIEAGGVSGSVKSVNMMTTVIVTPDNKVITIPNNTVMNSNIINYSAMTDRRIDFIFQVPYGTDLDLVYGILSDTMKQQEGYIPEKGVQVRLNEMSASSLDILVRAWVTNDTYWEVYYKMREQGYRALTENGIAIPYSQIDVHLDQNISKE